MKNQQQEQQDLTDSNYRKPTSLKNSWESCHRVCDYLLLYAVFSVSAKQPWFTSLRAISGGPKQFKMWQVRYTLNSSCAYAWRMYWKEGGHPSSPAQPWWVKMIVKACLLIITWRGRLWWGPAHHHYRQRPAILISHRSLPPGLAVTMITQLTHIVTEWGHTSRQNLQCKVEQFPQNHADVLFGSI